MLDDNLAYVPNPKHKEPWQQGRKGAMCPPWSHAIAQKLLDNSEPDGKARYATRDGYAFKAYPDGQGGWHGFPVGWNEVPVRIRNNWLKDKVIQRGDVRKHWDQTDAAHRG